jgi:hypothetical protein
VSLALDLLRILGKEGQQGADVEHDLLPPILGIYRVGARRVGCARAHTRTHTRSAHALRVVFGSRGACACVVVVVRTLGVKPSSEA